MKPVLVLQHLTGDGPATLSTWLRSKQIAFDVRNTEAGDDYPQDMDAYSALAVLGGEMSANDPLPSLRQAESLILQAMDRGLPVLGHCLGGQLMARALGARVRASPAPEVGWQTMQVTAHPLAQTWLGPAGPLTVFHWHGESFDLPAGAVLLASTEACPHQAFALGPHLAMQFHVELDAEKLQRWSLEATDEYVAARNQPSVHHARTMLQGAAVRLEAQQRLADRIYTRWIAQAPTG